MDPLISVIVPVFNTEKYLSECINSILAQTYQNFELILLDDGSSDHSYHICLSMQKTDERIKVFHHKNCGVSKTRNKGIALAQGKYIAFVDADDMIEKEYLNKLYCAICSKENDTSNLISICGFSRLYRDGKIVPENEKFDFFNAKEGVLKSAINQVLQCIVFGAVWRMLIPVQMITSERIAFSECTLKEDQLFLFVGRIDPVE